MAVDAWNMAAECARAIDASKDPTRRALVGTLQKLWIELGNKERLLSEQYVLKEMEDLRALHLATNALVRTAADTQTPSDRANDKARRDNPAGLGHTGRHAEAATTVRELSVAGPHTRARSARDGSAHQLSRPPRHAEIHQQALGDPP